MKHPSASHREAESRCEVDGTAASGELSGAQFQDDTLFLWSNEDAEIIPPHQSPEFADHKYDSQLESKTTSAEDRKSVPWLLWSADEENLLRQLVTAYYPDSKPNWKAIAAEFPQRSLPAIKTHWRILQMKDKTQASDNQPKKKAASMKRHSESFAFDFDTFLTSEYLDESSRERSVSLDSATTYVPGMSLEQGVEMNSVSFDDSGSFTTDPSMKRFRSASDDSSYDPMYGWPTCGPLTVLVPTVLLSKDVTPSTIASMVDGPVDTADSGLSERNGQQNEQHVAAIPYTEPNEDEDSMIWECFVHEMDKDASNVDGKCNHMNDDCDHSNDPQSPPEANHAVNFQHSTAAHPSISCSAFATAPAVMMVVPCIYSTNSAQRRVYGVDHHSLQGLQRPPPGFRLIQAPALVPQAVVAAPIPPHLMVATISASPSVSTNIPSANILHTISTLTEGDRDICGFHLDSTPTSTSMETGFNSRFVAHRDSNQIFEDA